MAAHVGRWLWYPLSLQLKLSAVLGGILLLLLAGIAVTWRINKDALLAAYSAGESLQPAAAAARAHPTDQGLEWLASLSAGC
jgi:hypothetical protein